MKSAVPKRRRSLHEMMIAIEPGAKGAKLKEEILVIKAADVTKPAASPELGPQVVLAIKKVREAMYPICSLRDVALRRLIEEHKITHGEFLLGSVYFVLCNRPYNVRSVRKDTNSR